MRMKVKGVSVQSIIIGSVITGVIAAAGLAALWPSVEKAKINAERVTINEVSNALTGVMEARMSGVTYVDGTVTDTLDPLVKDYAVGSQVMTEMKKRVAALPTYFTYHLAVENNAAGDAATYVIAQADSANTASVQRLKDVIDALDLQFDGIVDGATGKFRFDTTCDGTAGCFYAVHLADLGIDSATFGTVTAVPAEILDDAVATTNEAIQVTHGAIN